MQVRGPLVWHRRAQMEQRADCLLEEFQMPNEILEILLMTGNMTASSNTWPSESVAAGSAGHSD